MSDWHRKCHTSSEVRVMCDKLVVGKRQYLMEESETPRHRKRNMSDMTVFSKTRWRSNPQTQVQKDYDNIILLDHDIAMIRGAEKMSSPGPVATNPLLEMRLYKWSSWSQHPAAFHISLMNPDTLQT
ncbi:hypothetical protein C8J56DRAFT_896359 [Mycena floridula]|nr:hypothetical protein C8J56DRAFT_896359 [Mycena floridula]